MKPGLSHDEAFDELNAVAFDLLDAPERDAVLAHVEQCTVCREELDTLRATVAQLAFAAPAVSAPEGSQARVRDRLTSRAVSERVKTTATAPPGASMSAPASHLVFPAPVSRPSKPVLRPTSRWGAAEWIAVAASVLLIASLGVLSVAFRDRETLRAAVDAGFSQSLRGRQSTDSLVALLANRDSVLAGLTGRDVSVMTLTSSAAKEPFARMFWDRGTNTWTLIARNMPALRAGRTYQLWLVTPKGKISAGTFATTNGSGVVRATYALGANALQAIAVTEEPAGGVSQPTGEIIVAANATK
jgi:hypothetical protein